MVLINNGYNFMAFARHNKCKYDAKIIHESLKAYFQGALLKVHVYRI